MRQLWRILQEGRHWLLLLKLWECLVVAAAERACWGQERADQVKVMVENTKHERRRVGGAEDPDRKG